MRRVSAVLLFLSLILVSAQSLHTSARVAENCPSIVRTALTSASNLCQQIGRNQACYGHITLEAQPQPYVSLLEFSEEGDVADLADLRSIRLSVMDTVSGAWGISLMQLQANLPDNSPEKNVTMLLFGEVELESPERLTPESTATIRAVSNVSVRQSPSMKAKVVAQIESGQLVKAHGRLADNSWVRVSGPSGWVSGEKFAGPDDLQQLPVIDSAAQYYGPMQAFYFSSGEDDSLCSEAPDSGIVIQTPEGVGKVSLLINEVDIELGSTVYFQAQPGEDMIIRVVEGSAQVSAFDTTYKALAGMQITVPLDENLKAFGPPSPPTAYDLDDVKALPMSLLKRKVAINSPVDAEEAGMTTPIIEPSGEVVEPDPDDTSEPSTKVPGTATPEKPQPTSVQPTAVDPTKVPPTSVDPTKVQPTSVEPTDVQPTSVDPTDVQPTSVDPTDVPPTVIPPTSIPPTSIPPTSIPPTVIPPTNIPPTEIPPTDIPPTLGKKVTICHKGNTIEIDESSLPDHLAHGDTIGPCPTAEG